MQAQEITQLQKREQDLVQQLSVPLDARIQELLQQLKDNHEDLLHQQLAQLRRSYVQQAPGGEPIIVISQPSSDGTVTKTSTPITQVQADASGTLHFVMTQDGTAVCSDVTQSSAIDSGTGAGDMATAQIAHSNIVTTADGTELKIVAATSLDSTQGEALSGASLDTGETTQILVQEAVPQPNTEHAQEIHIEMTSEEEIPQPPPAKRKKGMKH